MSVRTKSCFKKPTHVPVQMHPLSLVSTCLASARISPDINLYDTSQRLVHRILRICKNFQSHSKTFHPIRGPPADRTADQPCSSPSDRQQQGVESSDERGRFQDTSTHNGSTKWRVGLRLLVGLRVVLSIMINSRMFDQVGGAAEGERKAHRYRQNS